MLRRSHLVEPEVPSAGLAGGASLIESSEREAFGRDLLQAFAVRPRSISPKYFYDAEGSRLFDRICELPEYYPTRTERAILSNHADAIAREIGPGAEIVEFGAGSCDKVRLLLPALQQPVRFRPIDISAEHLERAAAGLRRDYPSLDVQPLAADYTQRLLLPACEPGTRRVGFFPGSTIGNFSPREALAFLRMAAQALRGGGLLVGVDLVKSPDLLHAAYNDSQGVTAAFNVNLLARANRELGVGFDLAAFAHCAFYNAPLKRIEMHLVSRRSQAVVLDGRRFTLREGETLHTENSHKFTLEGLRLLARRAGFRPGPAWVDPQAWFAVQWLHAPI